MKQEKVEITKDRIKQLKEYFESNLPDQVQELIREGSELRTVQPHIGLCYDSVVNKRKSDEPFRLLVMGLEALDEKGISIEQRTSQILEEATKIPKSNPHMKGTTLLLQHIFRLLGYQLISGIDGGDGEYIGTKHIFNYFALSNWHITGAFKAGSNKANRTKGMNTIAVLNFIKQIEILEPSLVIFQSIKIWLDYYINKYGADGCPKWIGLKRENYKEYNLPDSDDYSVYIPDVNNIHKTLAIGFHHPASRGKNGKPWHSADFPYFKDVIKPVLTSVINNYEKYIKY